MPLSRQRGAPAGLQGVCDADEMAAVCENGPLMLEVRMEANLSTFLENFLRFPSAQVENHNQPTQQQLEHFWLQVATNSDKDRNFPYTTGRLMTGNLISFLSFLLITC